MKPSRSGKQDRQLYCFIQNFIEKCYTLRDSCQKTLHSMFKMSQEATAMMEDSSSSVSDSSDLEELSYCRA